MSTSGGSATIHQFSVHARARTSNDCARSENRPAATVSTLRLPDIVLNSNWYHETAIRDADKAGKH